jgi:hypothetical protein
MALTLIHIPQNTTLDNTSRVTKDGWRSASRRPRSLGVATAVGATVGRPPGDRRHMPLDGAYPYHGFEKPLERPRSHILVQSDGFRIVSLNISQ